LPQRRDTYGYDQGELEAGKAMAGESSTLARGQTTSPTTVPLFRDSVAGQLLTPAVICTLVPVVVATVLAVVVVVVTSRNTRQANEEVRREAQAAAASTHAAEAAAITGAVDRFWTERLDDAVEMGRDPAVVAAASTTYPETDDIAGLSLDLVETELDAPSDQLESSGALASALANRIAGSTAYEAVLVTDARGFTVAATASDDFVHRDDGWWQAAWLGGAYVGPSPPPDQTAAGSTGAAPGFIVAVRIVEPTTQQPLGVVKLSVDPRSLQDLVDVVGGAGSGVHIVVTSPDGAVVVRSSPASTVDAGPGLPNEVAVAAGTSRTGTVATDEIVGAFATTSQRYSIERLGIDVPGIDLVVAVSQPTDAALAYLQGLDEVAPTTESLTLPLILVALGLALLAGTGIYLAVRYVARRVADPILVLRDEADRLAASELPELVSLLRSGDSTGELPVVDLIDVDARGEVAELVDAFNGLRTTTVELAARLAIDHSKDLAAVLINLGQRNQRLIGRQLRFIDELELTESDPDVLRNLFTLDQMATRMRRYADNLLVLAGERVSRRTEGPQPAGDVIRAATSEVEDYARVDLLTIQRALVRPGVVSDLTHLLAELIENATRFSPPDTRVEVIGQWESDGRYTIAVLDLGPGLSQHELKAANTRITTAVPSGAGPTSHLGLYVVGRLAARHHIDVRLLESPISGTTAKVTLPSMCIAPVQQPAERATTSSGRRHARGAETRTSPWPPPIRPAATGPVPAVAVVTAGDAPAPASPRRPESASTDAPEAETDREPTAVDIATGPADGRHSGADEPAAERRAVVVRDGVSRFSDAVAAAKAAARAGSSTSTGTAPGPGLVESVPGAGTDAVGAPSQPLSTSGAGPEA
jgi:signal transduction histidine kinase